MKSKHLLLLGAAFCNLFTAVDSLHAQGTAFTYHGRLDDNGNSANGIYDFRFTIYAAASGGSIAGGSVDAGDVGVTNGQFALPLDFGSSPFAGGDRWLDIAVRPGASNGDFTNLVPRQKITATPYAIRAANFSGVVTASQLTGTISSQNIANGTITANMLAAGSVGTTQLADGSVTAGKIASGAVSGNLWTPTGAGAPSARFDHTAVWTGTELIVWGGYGANQLNDGARYNPALNTWTAINTNGAPAGRSLHTAVWTGTEMIIWGGNGETTHLNDGARYNPVSDTWTAINASGAPGARRYHTAIWTGTEMFVWGGGIGGGIQGVTKFNDGGRYHLSSDTWTPINPGNAPVARYLHTAVWTGNEMIIWGGLGVSYLGDGARYNPTGNSWTALNPTGAPAPRSSHTAVWTGTRMIVFGGAGTGNFNDGASYDLTSNGWTTTAGTTSPRFLHSAVWTGSEMFVWGGSAGVGPLNTGERYNPVTDAWTTFPTTGSPSARYYHTAIWSGTEMIVWGGSGGNGLLNDGARFRLSNIVPASIGSAQLAAPLQLSGATPSGSTLSGANSASEGAGVAGISTGGTNGVGVSGNGGTGTGVKGVASGFSGIGVSGISATGTGVSGESTSGNGVIGSTTTGRGVWGISYGSGLAGRFEGDVLAYGNVRANRGGGVGELGGETAAVEGRGAGGGPGVLGIGGSPNGNGVSGIAGVNGYGIYGSGNYYAGWFAGAVLVTGSLSKAGGNFRIDHPLDPANKYLSHSFVESPDMMNIYNGNITLDARGEAVVAMPEWFSALNKEFRYQLTCLGGFAPVFIAEEIANNRFKIAGGKSGLKVSWQVTGIRQDAWANAHRIPIEEDKPAKERGYYLHPAEIGQPTEKSVEWAKHPEMMQHRNERTTDSTPKK